MMTSPYFGADAMVSSIERIARWSVMLMLTLLGTSVAQERPAVIGGGAVYERPVGSLHDRFVGTTGGMVYAGTAVDANLTWLGVLRHTSFTQLNADALGKTVTVGQGTGARQYRLPLPKLTMELTTTAGVAEAHWSVLRSDIADVNGIVGFGFTRWEFYRGAYNDSLFTNDPVNGTPVKVASLAVPALRQADWSGTLVVGCEVTGRIAGPVWYTAGAEYKLIVGELWQTLDLDMENAAGMQTIGLRIGLHASL